ncbi:hypothetical protein LOTGIDRAFT_152576 [Lottia gigantea]|uniref:Uncharacterized protein n=1 Tax=Lottia gigantea TaxID=225164 RepID=V4BD17_LOTGI|nr:hypothetical protein LOTGIDRAFT_152576 [Lottia gigantea]ESP05706.1 hypothetical protein LOTGIDRAFT_152576 [Lottia gigantea]
MTVRMSQSRNLNRKVPITPRNHPDQVPDLIQVLLQAQGRLVPGGGGVTLGQGQGRNQETDITSGDEVHLIHGHDQDPQREGSQTPIGPALYARQETNCGTMAVSVVRLLMLINEALITSCEDKI